MTYNVGHYNMGLLQVGFPKDIFDEKVSNFKEMLMRYAPDIIGLQEDSVYVNQTKTIKSNSYLYEPIWRHRPSNNGSNIRSKFPAYANTSELVKFSSGRNYKKVILKVFGKRMLVLSAHPTAHEGNSAIRKQEYKELFECVNSEIWDYCIITGDFNTLEKIDKANLIAICAENEFSMAIGTYLPWVDTFLGRTEKSKHHSFDNILCSKNINIKSTRILREWWNRLYSDHVPIIADIEFTA
jgi:endonuclease/exonuclease/phosphatase family metal-dependent hydrolase